MLLSRCSGLPDYSSPYYFQMTLFTDMLDQRIPLEDPKILNCLEFTVELRCAAIEPAPSFA